MYLTTTQSCIQFDERYVYTVAYQPDRRRPLNRSSSPCCPKKVHPPTRGSVTPIEPDPRTRYNNHPSPKQRASPVLPSQPIRNSRAVSGTHRAAVITLSLRDNARSDRKSISPRGRSSARAPRGRRPEIISAAGIFKFTAAARATPYRRNNVDPAAARACTGTIGVAPRSAPMIKTGGDADEVAASLGGGCVPRGSCRGRDFSREGRGGAAVKRNISSRETPKCAAERGSEISGYMALGGRKIRTQSSRGMHGSQ